MKRLSRHKYTVLIRLPTTSQTNFEFTRGILEYVRLNSPWHILLSGGDDTYRSNDPVPGEPVDGAIISEGASRWTDILLARGIPVVTSILSATTRNAPNAITIDCDNDSISRLAASSLIESGFRHFAYVHFPGLPDYSVMRARAFAREIAQSGFTLAEWKTSKKTRFGLFPPRFGIWLKKLPPRTAIFAANDPTAHKVLVACRDMGIAVPERLAVLGADNNELLCEASTPTLSSIRFNTRDISFKACTLLDKAMRGVSLAPSERHLFYGAVKLAPRISTATKSIVSRPFNARLTSYIKTQLDATEGSSLSIPDISEAIGISRRQLEIDFKRETGRTIHEEIIRLRLERAARLLVSSSQPLAVIADDCGFANASHLCKLFKATYMTTPTAYRKLEHV